MIETASNLRKRNVAAVVASTLGSRAATWLVIAIFASMTLGAVELGISVFLQLFLKNLGLLNQEVRTISWFGPLTPAKLALGLVFLALARSSTLFLVGQSGNISMEMITARLRRIAIWETLLHPAKLFIPAASVNARVGDLANKSSQFSYSASVFVSSGFQTAALAVVMFFTARGETLIALVGLGLVGLVVLRMNRVVRRVAANIPRELRVLTEGIERVARNSMLVRVLRTERLEHRRLATSIDSYAGHGIHAAYLANFAGSLPPFAGIALIILLVAVSQSLLHTPGIMLLSFLYLFVRFVQALASAVLAFSTCNTTWPSFADSLAYVGKFSPAEIDDAMRIDERLLGRAIERPHSVGGEPPTIEIRSASFAYPGGRSNVLTDVTVTIAKGSQLGIVGPSGCGKSTLLGLILGMLEPSGGAVLIDGQRPSRYFDDPKTRVGYVGADAFLVSGTVRENLRYGLSTPAADVDLWNALESAQLRSTVEALPGGLEYPIAEDGSGLSAGQKQRLCLARALLGRPHLLVLDEVSANLDVATELEIGESLKALRGTCTTILVSHRRGILAYADAVVALERR